MVALAGMPGSGKTTSAAALARLLGSSCLVMPMDGFHLPMAALRERDDASDAIYRRGAPDTFDAAAFQATLKDISAADGKKQVLVPGFDHAVGDPTEGDVRFERCRHRIVLVEGLYLLHGADGWEGTAGLFDYKIYLDVDIDVCIARVKERNKCIPGYTAEEIDARCDKVDRSNAVIVGKSAFQADCEVSPGKRQRCP